MSHPIESVQSTTVTTIFDLNDDQVSSRISKHFCSLDLNAIADICVTFDKNAQAEFSTRFKKKDECEDPTQSLRTRIILQNFGSHQNNSIEVRLLFEGDSKNSMELIIQHCGFNVHASNVMKLYRITFIVDLILLVPLLLRIREIKLIGTQMAAGIDASTMILLCQELQKLTFLQIRNFPINCKISKLKSLKISRGFDLINETVESFLKETQNLKELELCDCIKLTSQVFEYIAQNTKQIEKITLKNYDGDCVENAKQLKELTALEWLDIDCRKNSFSPVIGALAASSIPLKLKFLKLTHFTEDSALFNEISKLKKLKTLVLFFSQNEIKLADVVSMVERLSELSDLRLQYTDEVSATNVLAIIRCAPKLQYLRLDSKHTITVDDKLYENIGEIVARRKPRCLLEIKFLPVSKKVQQKLLDSYQTSLKLDNTLSYKPYNIV